MVHSVVFSSDGKFLVSGSDDGTTKIWDMADGSSKTLASTNGDNTGVKSVAISSDGRLVAAGSFGGVRDLHSFAGMYSEYSPCRWYISGTPAPVNRWRSYGDTEPGCRV